MEIGTVLLLIGVAYAAGVLWYELLPGRLPEQVWRVAAYPFLGIFCAQALLPEIWDGDYTFGGIGVVAAAIGSLVAVAIDWIVTQARRPAVVPRFEQKVQPQAA